MYKVLKYYIVVKFPRHGISTNRISFAFDIVWNDYCFRVKHFHTLSSKKEVEFRLEFQKVWYKQKSWLSPEVNYRGPRGLAVFYLLQEMFYQMHIFIVFKLSRFIGKMICVMCY